MSRAWVADKILPELARGARLLELRRRCELSAKQVECGLQVLRRRGFARSIDRGLWALTDAGRRAMLAGVLVRPGGANQTRRARHPKHRTFRQRAWSQLRRVGKTTIPELLCTLDAGDDPRAAHNLEVYFGRLVEARLLLRLVRRAQGEALTSPGHVVWILPEDPGPKRPSGVRPRGSFTTPTASGIIQSN